MARTYKCWIGNLDGRRQGLVIATSQRRAVEVIGTTVGDFRRFWCEQRTVLDGYEPNTLYTRRYGGSAQEPFYKGKVE
jgi:hypothetical protein